MDKPKLKFIFHNPNSNAETADFLVKFLPEITYYSKILEKNMQPEEAKR